MNRKFSIMNMVKLDGKYETGKLSEQEYSKKRKSLQHQAQSKFINISVPIMAQGEGKSNGKHQNK